MHSGGLPEDHSGGQDPAAWDLQEGRRQRADQGVKLPLQVVDLGNQVLAAQQQPTTDPGDHTVEAVQLVKEAGHDVLTPQAPAGDLQVGIQLVEVPADLCGDPRTLNDEVSTVVGQELDLASGEPPWVWWRL